MDEASCCVPRYRPLGVSQVSVRVPPEWAERSQLGGAKILYQARRALA